MEPEIQKSFIDSITVYTQLIFIVVQGVAAFILAVLTYFYLQETRKTRQISARALEMEWGAYLETDLTSVFEVNESRSTLDIHSDFSINNTGKLIISPLDIEIILDFGQEYDASQNVKLTKQVSRLSTSYTYPFIFNISVDSRDLEIFTYAYQEQTLTVVPKYKELPTITAEVILQYKNVQDEYKTIKEKYQYTVNHWQKIT